MTYLKNVWIYNSAYRSFDFGSIAFDKTIRHVERNFDEESHGGLVVIPGFIDIHMHIESSMTSPSEFSNAVLPHGTTTVVADCHEVANVFGVEGLEAYMDLPSLLDVFYAIPSSVPSTSKELETSGGQIDASEVEQLCKRDDILALGEIMNANDLFSEEDNRTKRIIKAFKTCRPDSPIEGHCPKISGEQLSKFIASGVDSDHTEQTAQSIMEKVSAGMFLEIQQKSVKKETIKALCDEYLAGTFCFCTDDVMSDVLQEKGHLDAVVKQAIFYGMPITEAIYAATYAPAMRMRLFDRGQIAPGKLADLLVIDDLETLHIKAIFKNGAMVYDSSNGLVTPTKLPNLDKKYLNSIQRKKISEKDFDLSCPDGNRDILVIEKDTATTFTKKGRQTVDVVDNTFDYFAAGLNVIASVERYGHESPIKPAFLKNGLKKSGAICSSWAHDSHNLLVLATSVELAVRAVNLVIENQGGIALVDEQKESFVPLAYGGIVSLEPMPKLAKQIKGVRKWLKDHGYEAREEVMNFAVLSLPVSPELKISDKGLVDVVQKRVLDWRTYYSDGNKSK
ncbi:adenine deaminase [Sphaerochaeta pleomorpha str. Grapes]|uniref:Adenine deaminase n=1 Tax=Sphaerochaeta pleomorpha (strain ATCC BAA-1885 / DSM 22778 / Grapes) TaxID=158190 RepID=G8QQS3_SPHPG|nr:adenine deaminase C-terminal domain-containing protein [Sphaerochaeta pleomorpha]AEV28704.1 adenine deaminase [Sphaerochaeta pleomorpha str. Grapes]